MKETMTENHDLPINTQVLEQPIKLVGDQTAELTLVQQQADVAKECVRTVDYYAVRGTCMDERKRVGLLNGSSEVEVRPSVPGGPNVYALAVAELAGFDFEPAASGAERLGSITEKLRAAGIRSGGHAKCAANAAFNGWLGIMASNPETIKAYGQQELAERYDENIMQGVIDQAQMLVESDRYAAWNEQVLVDVLGDEAGDAIEVLADVPHEGVVVERNRVPNTTIDQNELYDRSIIGRGSFNIDDDYALAIERAIFGDSADESQMLLAAHIREAVTAAVAGAVPNTELYEDRLLPA